MMDKNILQDLQGQKLYIHKLLLETRDTSLFLTLIVFHNQIEYQLAFLNVSALKIDNISFPATICGFEIIDNKACGWQSDVRYTVHDFEEHSISFYCEKIQAKKQINTGED